MKKFVLFGLIILLTSCGGDMSSDELIEKDGVFYKESIFGSSLYTGSTEDYSEETSSYGKVTVNLVEKIYQNGKLNEVINKRDCGATTILGNVYYHQHGTHNTYHPNGELAETTEYDCGDKEKYQKYHDNGQLAVSGEYDYSGDESGYWKFFDRDGSLYAVESNGKPSHVLYVSEGWRELSKMERFHKLAIYQSNGTRKSEEVVSYTQISSGGYGQINNLDKIKRTTGRWFFLNDIENMVYMEEKLSGYCEGLFLRYYDERDGTTINLKCTKTIIEGIPHKYSISSIEAFERNMQFAKKMAGALSICGDIDVSKTQKVIDDWEKCIINIYGT